MVVPDSVQLLCHETLLGVVAQSSGDSLVTIPLVHNLFKRMASTDITSGGNINENYVGIPMKKKHTSQFKQPGKIKPRPNKRQGSDRGRLTVFYSIKINQENADF